MTHSIDFEGEKSAGTEFTINLEGEISLKVHFIYYFVVSGKSGTFYY